MKKIVSAFALSTLALACAKTPITANNGIARIARDLHTSEALPPAPQVDAATAKEMPKLSNPGDFVVVRFSGSYHKSAMTLTQRVLSREGTVAYMELTLAEGKKSQTLRAHVDQSNGSDRVIDVIKIENGKERPAPIASYDALMQKTLPDVDMNEETMGTETAEVALGGRTVAGSVTRYKVNVAGKDATMSIFHADGFAWGDLAGDITSRDGKLIYKAEIVDVGNDATATASASR